MCQIPRNTNSALADNCPLIDSVFLAGKLTFVNEKFVYVGNHNMTVVLEIDLALMVTAQSESRFTVSTTPGELT